MSNATPPRDDDPLSFFPVYCVLAVISIGIAIPFGGLFLFAAACLFWAIVFSAWAIHGKLTEIANLLRSRDK